MIWCVRQLVRTFQTKFQSKPIWTHHSVPVKTLCIWRSASRHVSYSSVFRLAQKSPFVVLLCNKWNSIQCSHHPTKCHGTNCHRILRQYSTVQEKTRKTNLSIVLYITAVAIIVLGISYAAVPLYRLFCQVLLIHCVDILIQCFSFQATGYGGTVYVVTDTERVETMKPVKERELTIKFNADTSPKLRWKFKPHQSEIVVIYPYQQRIVFSCFL